MVMYMTDSQTQNNMLAEGTKRDIGRDAQKINIMVAKAVANSIKSTLGPRGMDKMLVDELGDVTITNDGATILKEMSISHPVGKMFVELAKNQDTEIGDGTTTAVIIAGELVSKAGNLIDENIHPSIIIKGYKMAAEKANEFFEEISEPINLDNKNLIFNIARTTMTGKASDYSNNLAEIVVDAVLKIANNDVNKISRDQIKIEKKQGSSLLESELIDGIVLDKEIVHSEMPKDIENPKVLVLNSALEIKEPETDTKIQINTPEQLQSFIDQEEQTLKDMVNKIVQSGANVVFCQKGIDDLAQHYLANNGISAVRRVKQSDIERLAKASGARIINRLDDLTKEHLGTFNHIFEKKIADDEMIFIEGGNNINTVTILLRGSSEQVLAETERTVNDAIGAVISALKVGKYVYGGGSSEVEVSLKLTNYAKSIGGREQLAIEAFSEVLNVIPKILSESAGLDAIDTIVSLKSKHQDIKNKAYGVDVINGSINNISELNVIEPLNVKTQAINSASEVVEMILRIDDIIAASSGNKQMMPPKMPPM